MTKKLKKYTFVYNPLLGERNNKMKITTIKLKKETKERIDKLRESKSESYDDILRKIFYVLNNTRDNPEKGKRILEQIETRRALRIRQEREQKEESKNSDKL
jgi:hypothetical protein